ncbi:MAG: dihydropteroate synthase [Candidatus Promineofilum sp.]|jgi:dihydropteroate synthase|nr:dihydropteroate synthase [Promineifilum sp.]
MTFQWGQRTYVMGIINVTPDSFSGDGVATVVADPPPREVVARAVDQARQFLADGADILDVGGESTRPGSVPVSAEEELARVLPVVRALRAALPEATISVDTYRAAVAAAALDSGADWINDVWGLRMDPHMAALAAARGCPVVIMHNRSKPKDVAQEQRLGGRYVGIRYTELITDIARELAEQMAIAFAAGVREEQIILDPGIGFGKTVEQNLELLDRLGELKALGRPLLIGPSRKSFIGYTLDLPPEDRVEGTAAAVAIGIDRGADIVRVHDVRAIARVARMTDRIVRRAAPSQPGRAGS